MRRRMPVTAAAATALVAGVLVLSACTSGGPPARFLEREPLTSCGAVTLAQGEEVAAADWDCLETTPGGAELVVTGPTIEGEPITTWHRKLANGDSERYTDMTQDSFGGGWWYDFCPAADDDTAECTSEKL